MYFGCSAVESFDFSTIDQMRRSTCDVIYMLLSVGEMSTFASPTCGPMTEFSQLTFLPFDVREW
jgi:hypothetical protein